VKKTSRRGFVTSSHHASRLRVVDTVHAKSFIPTMLSPLLCAVIRQVLISRFFS
jgi:hypothetical protein